MSQCSHPRLEQGEVTTKGYLGDGPDLTNIYTYHCVDCKAVLQGRFAMIAIAETVDEAVDKIATEVARWYYGGSYD